MRISKTIIRLSLSLFLATSCSHRQQTKSPQEMEESCRNFVQEFYNWYIAKSAEQDNKTREERGDEVMGSDPLKYRKEAFSPELFRALKEDSEAQANSPDAIVGLNYDPFL